MKENEEMKNEQLDDSLKQKESQQGNTKTESDETSSSDKSKDDDNIEEEKDPLDVALQEIESLKDKYLRSVAEFDNYRKRTLKEKTELILNGSEKAVVAFLPIIDDMERAIDNAEKTEDVETLKEGMKLIFHKMNKVMESLGVKKMNTENADFDTDFHEAIAMVPGVEDDKKGKILDCVQTGYMLNDKVIRHAKVAVGQ
ncbi:MAG: nucleotide exchange factor GrpE [Prevotella sp.]|nr:nucleotide exchange factor GrpE [Prevotella sp.]